MEMFKDNISHFNQLLLDRSAEIIFIIKNFSDVFKEILINYINNGDYGQFKRVLIVISYLLTNNKINLNEVLCEELERGFKKFKNKEMDIISTKEISKAALVCAKNYKLTDKYVYVSNPDKFKQMIVITDPNNKRFGVINQKGGVVIPAEYVTLSLAKNDTYVGRASDGEIRIFDKDGNIINT
jgi:hypothetical protein